MEWTIYKPTRKQTGGAIKFNLHKTGKHSFMKAAPQIGEIGGSRIFAWEEGCINVKMELNDLSAILAVIYGKKSEVKLFHKTERDNKMITFNHVPDRGGYSINVSQKVDEKNPKVFIGISYEEAMILKVYIENTMASMLKTNVWVAKTSE